MRYTLATIAIALALLVAGASAAHADVDVKPNPKSPILKLEAKREMPSQSATPQSIDLRLAPVAEPVRDTDDECTQVAGLLVCGFARTSVGDVAKDTKDKKAKKLKVGDILQAVRTIGLPSLEAQVQPGTATLVNFDTILSANPQRFQRSITLLGFDIEVIATPVRYHWHHGDGTAQTTTNPGRSYPHKDITHRYARTAKQVMVNVDAEYSVRYRVDGGPWATIAQHLTAPGPTTALEVKEATAVLAK